MKMTLEEQNTVEEVTYRIVEATDEVEANGSRSKRETALTEQLTSVFQEERRRFIIKDVVDPRNGVKISFQDAVSLGIINHSRGHYLNPDTGQGLNGFGCLCLFQLIKAVLKCTLISCSSCM